MGTSPKKLDDVSEKLHQPGELEADFDNGTWKSFHFVMKNIAYRCMYCIIYVIT